MCTALVSRPEASRSNRTMQHFFVNGRYVKTRTAMAAAEEACKGSVMAGKYPACVLHIDLPAETVDANVHPAKIEVRFVQERPVFDAVYHGVKSALQAGGGPKNVTLPRAPFRQETAVTKGTSAAAFFPAGAGNPSPVGFSCAAGYCVGSCGPGAGTRATRCATAPLCGGRRRRALSTVPLWIFLWRRNLPRRLPGKRQWFLPPNRRLKKFRSRSH